MSNLIPSPNQNLSQGGPVSTDVQSEAGNQPTAQLPKIELREVFNAVMRRAWIVGVFGVLAAVATFVYVSSLPVLYPSYGAIYVKTHAPQVFSGVNAIAQEESKDLEQMKTVEAGLQSSTVLMELVERHGLRDDPTFVKGLVTPQVLLETMRDRVGVGLRKGTRLIDIQVEDTDPQRAVRMVEDLVAIYEDWKTDGRAELIKKTSEDLQREVARLKKKMAGSEARLEKFRGDNPVLGLNVNLEQTQEGKLGMLNQQLTTATAERLRLETEMATLNGRGKSNASDRLMAAKGEQAQLILQLERELSQQEALFAQVDERYGPKHPKHIEATNVIRNLKDSIRTVERDAKDSLAARLAMVREREERLTALTQDAKKQALADEQLREKFVRLSREVAIDRDLHAQVSKRLQETQIGASLSASVLRWDERPIPADDASRPAKKAFLLAGTALGLMMGVFFGLLIELLDRKVREVSAVERVLKLKPLATLPVYNRDVVRELGVESSQVAHRRGTPLSRLTSARGEGDEQTQIFLFASTFDGDGKTLSVLKSARTFVKQGYRTLVVDADFCRAGLSRQFSERIGGRHGLSAFLSGEIEAAETLYETGLPGLWFLPTGNVSGDTGDLLSGPDFRLLLEAIRPMFDRIIFDVGSTTEVDDVQAIARFANASYFVVRKGAGRYGDLKAAVTMLRSAGGVVAGVIWNEGGGRRRKAIEPVIEPQEVVQQAQAIDAEEVTGKRSVG
ncbi:MAG: hypothetical protein AAGC74_02845 [Verrucomicrobiota bacterium]